MAFTRSGFDVKVDLKKYTNGRLAIRLVATDTENNKEQECYPGEAISTVTVNIPEVELKAEEVIIKIWGENEGIIESFPPGILTPVREVEVNHVVALVAAVNMDLLLAEAA